MSQTEQTRAIIRDYLSALNENETDRIPIEKFGQLGLDVPGKGQIFLGGGRFQHLENGFDTVGERKRPYTQREVPRLQ